MTTNFLQKIAMVEIRYYGTNSALVRSRPEVHTLTSSQGRSGSLVVLLNPQQLNVV